MALSDPQTISLEQTREHWMRRALELAEQARDRDEVPVGAVLVLGDRELGRGFNQPRSTHDPTAHAEIVALRHAAARIENYRLPGTTLYVTIEPCTMCLGALIHARVDTLVFGAREPRAGAVVSRRQLADENYYNHELQVVEGVMAAESGELLNRFFKSRRN